MTWVTWVTWVFVGLAVAVAAAAWAIASGRLRAGLEEPYDEERAAPQMPEPSLGQPAVRYVEPAAGRPDLAGTDRIDPTDAGATDLQHHPRTTGEPADGRHEAQDR